MKKLMLPTLCMMIMFSLSAAVSAQDELKVRGEVTKVDAAAKSLTIQPREGAAVTVATGEVSKPPRLRQGDKAEATYRVKNGVNTASRVRKLVEGCN